MFKIDLKEYKETKIYFQLFDVLLKNLDVKKELYLIDNGITPSSYRLARKQEQNIGKLIIKTLCDKLKYKIPDELQIIEIEEKFNKIYFDMYYKINDDYDKYLKYIDELLEKNYIIFPLIKLMKLFLIANSFRDVGKIVEENKNLFNELQLYTSFFNNSMFEIFDILNCSFSDININDYISKKYDNGLFYYSISAKCLNKELYMETLHFGNKCKEILLKESNYNRLIFLNLKILNCYNHFKNYQECYNISKAQQLALKSLNVTGTLVSYTNKHFLVSCIALKKYEEAIKLIEGENTIYLTELIVYLVSLYNTNQIKYEEVFNEYVEMIKNLDDETNSMFSISLAIINDYLRFGKKKRLKELKSNGAMFVLIEILEDA